MPEPIFRKDRHPDLVFRKPVAGSQEPEGPCFRLPATDFPLPIKRNIPLELALLLALLTDDQEKISNYLSQNIDWSLLTELALRHRVYPIVYRQLVGRSEVPAATLTKLKKLDDANKIKTLRLVRENVRLVQLLEDRNVECLIAKGVPLAHTVYKDITLRPCKDIDLFVRVEDLSIICEILESSGYQRKFPSFELTPWRLKYYAKHFREYVFINKSTGVCVEPHWKIDYLNYQMSVFENKKIIDLFNQKISILSPEDNFVYLSLHAAIHCFWRLRWLNDIALILKSPQQTDWQKVQKLAADMQATPVVHQAIILASQLFNAPIPAEFIAAIDNDKKAHQLANISFKYIVTNAYKFDGDVRHYLFYLYRYYCYYLLPNWSSRLKFMFADIFNLERTIAAFNMPDRLSYLYYIVHPFVFVKRIFVKKH